MQGNLRDSLEASLTATRRSGAQLSGLLLRQRPVHRSWAVHGRGQWIGRTEIPVINPDGNPSHQ